MKIYQVVDTGTVEGYHAVPTADATANARMRDVVGNKTDAAVVTVGTVATIIAYVKGLLNSLATHATALATHNTTLGVVEGYHAIATTDTAVNAHMRDVVGNKLDTAQTTVGGIRSTIAYVKGLLNIALDHQYQKLTKVATFTNLTVDDPLFTVIGEVIVRVIAVVMTDLASVGGGTVSVGIGTDDGALIGAVDYFALVAREIWYDTTPDAEVELLSTCAERIITNGQDIYLHPSAQVDSGAITFYCYWRKLSSDGSVVAAA